MRHERDYRGAYRNEMRGSTGRINSWADTLAWVRANIKAKWEERRQVCAQARDVAVRAAVGAIRLGRRAMHEATNAALREFWGNQKPVTRVVWRIVHRELHA